MSGWEDGARLLAAFVRTPDRIGSVWPTSPALAERVVQAAALGKDGVVVELGAGTGPVTDAIRRAHPTARLVALEPDRALFAALVASRPGLCAVPCAAGRDLPRVLASVDVGPVDRVVSGLPWTLWDASTQAGVLDGVVAALQPDGRFVTYVYLSGEGRPASRAFKALLASRFERVWHTETVWRNLPPAVVLVADGPRASAGGRGEDGEQPEQSER